MIKETRKTKKTQKGTKREGGALELGFPDFQPTQVNGPKTPLKQRFVSKDNKFLQGDFSFSAIV